MEIRVDLLGRRRWICQGLKGCGWVEGCVASALHACMYSACHVTRDAFVHRRMNLLTWMNRNETTRKKINCTREGDLDKMEMGSEKANHLCDRGIAQPHLDLLIRLHLPQAFWYLKSEDKKAQAAHISDNLQVRKIHFLI